MARPTRTFYVYVYNLETREIVKRMGPMTEHKAWKVDSGVSINMGEDFTSVVEQVVLEEGDTFPEFEE